jgi:hypothetical protein
MSETEREALAEVIGSRNAYGGVYVVNRNSRLGVADLILASDWLAQVKATARAEGVAQPHECEGQRQLAALARLVASEPQRLRDGIAALADELSAEEHGPEGTHFDDQPQCSTCALLTKLRALLDGVQ